MQKIRKFLSNRMSIHIMVLLGLAALWGFIETENKYLLLLTALFFAGAICGGFVTIIDKMNKRS